MHNSFFDHSLLHIPLDSPLRPVKSSLTGKESSIEPLTRSQPDLFPNPILLDAMPGKSQKPGKRRKYRRSSILSHSHPPMPEGTPNSPTSQMIVTPESKTFSTPVLDNAYTPASVFSPSPLRKKQNASQTIRSETPICDALSKAGILPYRGPVRPWPKDPVFEETGWRTPCEMNGIHEAMNRIRFKEKLMRAAEESERRKTSEKSRSRALSTKSASKRARNKHLI